MAFLCPVRIRRGKKKKSSSSDGDKDLSGMGGMGRITGSASIETLVRVGLEKEAGLCPDSKMVVLHDFAPCVDDELEVRRGQVVQLVYRENDWLYVLLEGGGGAAGTQEGFIPYSYCAPCPPRAPAPTPGPAPHDAHAHDAQHDPELDLKKKLPRAEVPPPHDISQLSLGGSEAAAAAAAAAEGEGCPFSKDPSGRYIVMYTFHATDENDVDVERGEFVTVLNREDPDWYWIVRSDGQEGFIPSGFVYPALSHPQHSQHSQHSQQQQHAPLGLARGTGGGAASPGSPGSGGSSGGGAPADQQPRYQGTELVMLYDYKAQAPDDLSVARGEWVVADLVHQTVEGWVWAHAPSTRRSGFIPTAYARPPHTTTL